MKDTTMKLSARNQIRGTVTAIAKGANTSHVSIDIGGTTVMAAITNEAVADLGLTVGKPAYAVIKASDVLVGVED
ncbi:molybdenum-pterin-binding protein [Acetobacter aceti NRIC 0242]|nr:molybdenum-pterin-binding protein [Acetobacter aceti NRIC 0242]